jgi:hypothetical protein
MFGRHRPSATFVMRIVRDIPDTTHASSASSRTEDGLVANLTLGLKVGAVLADEHGAREQRSRSDPARTP